MKIQLAVAVTLVLAGSSAVMLAAHSQQSPVVRPDEPILPLPAAVAGLDPGRVKLGERLFNDKRLSGDGTVSCQSCHLPHAGGADTRRYSVSAFGNIRQVNSPSIYNLHFNTSGLNWTGRTASLERQIEGAVGNADTMGFDWNKAIVVLTADTVMSAEFKAIYGGDNPVNQKNAMDAVVTYEKSRVTPSRFDDWLAGNDKAITAVEKQGYLQFKAKGCVSCHNGINVGGNSFAKLGVVGNYFADRAKRGKGELNDFDNGRMLQTKKPEDQHVFRVAPLRNVALTAPYFHDGSVETLDHAIELMGRHQLGVEIPPADRKLIAAFLGSLTGKEFETNRTASASD